MKINIFKKISIVGKWKFNSPTRNSGENSGPVARLGAVIWLAAWRFPRLFLQTIGTKPYRILRPLPVSMSLSRTDAHALFPLSSFLFRS